jgi:hypothetical protein
MKTISLSVVAILLAGATVFANGGPVHKHAAQKAKQECTGKCIKDGKVVDCPDPASCPDKANCHPMPCTDKCCS